MTIAECVQLGLPFCTQVGHTGHEHAVEGLDELGLSEAARHDYLHANAARLFPAVEILGS